jgi:hypothetical protein
VAARTFAVSVFVVFLLWATKALGLVGLMGAFSIGLISFSMDSNLELAMASMVLAGIAIKYVLPLIQSKWIEKFADATPVVLPAEKAAPAVVERIAKMRSGEKKIEGFSGGRKQGLLEGFEDAMVSTTSGVQTTSTGAMGAGGMPTGGATTVSAPATMTTVVPTSTITSVSTTPGAGIAGPTGGGVPSALTGNVAVGATSTPAVSSTISNIAGQGGAPAGATMQVPMPSMTASMPVMTTVSTTGATPSATGGAGTVAGAVSGSMQMMGAGARAMAVNAAPVVGAPPTAPQTTVATGAIAAPVGQQVPSTLVMPTAQVAQPQMAVNTALQPTVQAFTGDIESFDGQDASSEPPGLFKLGQLPGETKAGPHIDAGTTIMRALGGLNPRQVEALTQDTQKLLETQKSLMGMITSMKPILQDGAGMLQSFQGLFGGK